MDIDLWLQQRLAMIAPRLNEKQRRLVAAADVRLVGYGGVSRVARATGMSRPTIYEGLKLLEGGTGDSQDRVRRVGGGRKKIREQDMSIMRDLELLVDPVARGDPTSPLRWTCQSTRQLARALVERGHRVSHRVVADLLRQQGYSLQANRWGITLALSTSDAITTPPVWRWPAFGGGGLGWVHPDTSSSLPTSPAGHRAFLDLWDIPGLN